MSPSSPPPIHHNSKGAQEEEEEEEEEEEAAAHPHSNNDEEDDPERCNGDLRNSMPRSPMHLHTLAPTTNPAMPQNPKEVTLPPPPPPPLLAPAMTKNPKEQDTLVAAPPLPSPAMVEKAAMAGHPKVVHTLAAVSSSSSSSLPSHGRTENAVMDANPEERDAFALPFLAAMANSAMAEKPREGDTLAAASLSPAVTENVAMAGNPKVVGGVTIVASSALPSPLATENPKGPDTLPVSSSSSPLHSQSPAAMPGNSNSLVPESEFLAVGPPSKRAKVAVGKEDEAATLKRVAEIVLVLAGLGEMRAGRPPSSIERRLQAEAYARLGFLVQQINPRDLAPPPHALSALAQSLGLTKPKRTPEEKALAIKQSLHRPFHESHNSATWLEKMQQEGQNPAEKIAGFRRMEEVAGPAKVDTGRNGEDRYAAHDSRDLDYDGSSTSAGNVPGGSMAEPVEKFIRRQQPMQQNKAQMSPALQKPYMSVPVPCEICKKTIADTATVLICDGCEKAFHLKCLQSYQIRGTPKGDWHCAKCTIDAQGRPQMPKYGPIRQAGAASFCFERTTALLAGVSARIFVIKNPGGVQSAIPATQKVVGNEIGGQAMVAGRDKARGVGSVKMGSKRAVPTMPTKKIAPDGRQSGQPNLTPPPNSSSHQTQQDRSPAVPLLEQTGHHTESNENASFSKSQLSNMHVFTPMQAQSQPASGPGIAESSQNHALPIVGGGVIGASCEQKTVERNAGLGKKLESADQFGAEWVGDAVRNYEGKVFYSACRVAGNVFKLQDYALFRPESLEIPPYIARLQALWEDSASGLKWARVNWCYYPVDIPSVVGRPSNPEANEVYESNHGDNNLVGSIQGPCMVLRPESYFWEIETRREMLKNGQTRSLVPIFLCRWLYDAPRGNFKPAVENNPSQ